MRSFGKQSRHLRRWFLSFALLGAAFIPHVLHAQTCLTADDMDQPTKTALTNTAKSFFDMAAKGDAATLQQNTIASLASNFSGVAASIKAHQSDFASAQVSARSPFELTTTGTTPSQNAEFLCGVFNASGQTSNSTIISIPNLPSGTYGLVTLDVAAPKEPDMVSFILQQQGTAWKLGGFFVKAKEITGHDADWFLQKARDFKSKSQMHDAWFYFIEGRNLMVPVDFMSTQATDKVYTEMQSVKPADLPPSDLAVDGKTYKLTALFPLPVGNDLDLIVRFEFPDVSNTPQAFQANMAVIKGLVQKYPELRQAFNGVVARATEPSGKDYGSLLPMNEIK